MDHHLVHIQIRYYQIASRSNSALLANQSLKLTEPAVGNLMRAKQAVTIGQDLARADWIPSLRRFAAAA